MTEPLKTSFAVIIMIIIGLAIIILIGYWIKYVSPPPQEAGLQLGPRFIIKEGGVKEQVIALQKRVGAKQDGIIGHETMALTNEAVKQEERAVVKQKEAELFNQYANKWFDPNSYSTGEPNEKSK